MKGSNFTYTFPSDPGAYFTVEVSTTLEVGSWSDVETLKAEGSISTTTLYGLRNEAGRFWRVKRSH